MLPAVVRFYDFQARYGIAIGGKDLDQSAEWNRPPKPIDLAPTSQAKRKLHRKK